MKILAHRGYWLKPHEKNGEAALQRAATSGFGTETDVRDMGGRLVISHDPPTTGGVDLADLISVYADSGLTLAINVKADGLAIPLRSALEASGTPWFAFDMSAPEQWQYTNAGVPTFTRQSDIEPEPILYAQAEGVWLDAFHTEWFDADVIDRHLAAGKKVCVVSPDLHARPVAPVWDWLFASQIARSDDLFLCTDHPAKAHEEMMARL